MTDIRDSTTGVAGVVRAAGTVLWRSVPGHGKGNGKAVELAVVHRPRYDDWSLPKGKCDRGETPPACAVRETEEETGFRPVLGRHVRQVRYPLPGGATKVVDYYSGRATDGTFAPGNEVDELRWLAPDAAAELVSRNTDRDVLAAFTALGADTTTVLFVRHAKAGKRENWRGDDDLRPLSPAGLRQAEALRAMLALFGPVSVHAAPKVRCERTVSGLAADLNTTLVPEPLLTEESYHRDADSAVRRLAEIAASGGTAVVCGQGGAIPGIIDRFAVADDLWLDELPCKKGSVWVLSFTRATGKRPPRLVAAYYLPSALPLPGP